MAILDEMRSLSQDEDTIINSFSKNDLCEDFESHGKLAKEYARVAATHRVCYVRSQRGRPRNIWLGIAVIIEFHSSSDRC